MTGMDCSEKQYIQRDQIDGLIAVAGLESTTEILDAFWRSTQELLTQIEHTLEITDFDEMAKLTHALKGSASNVGAQAICDATKVLELCCKNKDQTSCLNALRYLKADIEATSDAFSQHLENARAQVA